MRGVRVIWLTRRRSERPAGQIKGGAIRTNHIARADNTARLARLGRQEGRMRRARRRALPTDATNPSLPTAHGSGTQFCRHGNCQTRAVSIPQAT